MKKDFTLGDSENFLSEVLDNSFEKSKTIHSVIRDRVAEVDPQRALQIPNHIYVSDPKQKMHTAMVEEIARIAHFGQVDKLGVDYIEHPRAVAILAENSVPSAQDYDLSSTLHIKWAALLHDVVEDTPLTLGDLSKLGVPNSLLRTVNELTRKPKMDSQLYYSRILNNKHARVVKIADMMHNCAPDRMALLDEKTRTRLTGKYSKGIEILTKDYPEDRKAFRELTGI